MAEDMGDFREDIGSIKTGIMDIQKRLDKLNGSMEKTVTKESCTLKMEQLRLRVILTLVGVGVALGGSATKLVDTLIQKGLSP